METFSPMSLYRVSVLTMDMPSARHSYAHLSSLNASFLLLSTPSATSSLAVFSVALLLLSPLLPTNTVSFKSPWYPPKNAVTSIFTISPSSNGRQSGIP